MIDLHCHLLPGVDDGARNITEALDLARAAVEDGITHCIATPHIQLGRFANDIHSIASAYSELQWALDRENLPLKLGMAAEIRISGELLSLVALNQVPFLGEWYGFKVLLLEMPHSHIPPGTEKLIRWLRTKRIRPMIAHPERNKDLIRDFSKVRPLVREGALFQLNAGSLIGHCGASVQQCAFEFLEHDLATAVASDAHHAVARPPLLSQARKVVARLVGDEKSWNLVAGNPGKITAIHFTRRMNRISCIPL